MQFQGLTREERFSDNQIRIDINSVIENDLAEADRQSKYLGRNADMEGQWNNMYLNKLISKHENEKINRKENFASYMKNREEIQNIIKYNNEVKYQDAGKNRHVKSLESILGEGLFKLAINVGSMAIKKGFGELKKSQDLAKKEEHDANVGTILDTQARMNDSAKQAISTEAMDELRQSTAQKEAILVKAKELNVLDPNISVDEYRSLLRASVGVTKMQYQTALNSPQNITNNLEQFAPNFLLDHNGVEVNQAMVESGQVNRALGMQWRQEMATAFRKEYDINTLLPSVRGIVTGAIADWEGRSRKRESNSRHGIAKKETRRNYAHDFEALGNGPDGRRAQVDYMLNPNGGGPTQISGRRDLGWDMLGDFAEKVWDLPTINRFMEPGEHNNWRNLLTEKSERGDEWRKIRAEKVKDDYRALQTHGIEVDRAIGQMNAAVPNYTPSEARTLHNSLNNKGKVWETVQEGSPGAVSKLNTLLLNQARITPAPVPSTARAQAKKIYPKTSRTGYISSIITDPDGNNVDLSIFTGQAAYNVGKTKANLDHIFVSWVAKQIDRIGLPAEDPRVITEITGILNNEKHGEYITLKEDMKLKTKDAKGNPLKGGPVLVNFNLPAVQSNGVAEYKSLRANNPGRKIGLDEIDLSFLEDFVKLNSAAIANNDIDQQNTLGLGNPLIKLIRQHNPTWTPGHIYNAAVAQFKKQGIMDYQTLPESQYLTPAEARQFIDQFGAHYKNATPQLQGVIQRNHANHGGHPPNTVTRGIIGKLEGNVPQNERYRSGDVGTPNAQGVWRNQFYADQAASIAAAYPNMTWTSTLRSDAHNRRVGGVANSKHKQGISFDVVGADAQKLKQDIDAGRVQGVDYYIGPGYTHIHFNILGTVSIGGNN